MCLPEELWSAMHDVATVARREKHPSMLQDLGKIADYSLAEWRHCSASQFASVARNLVSKCMISLLKPDPVEVLLLTKSFLRRSQQFTRLQTARVNLLH